MGVREQVIAGFNEFMADDNQSAGFKSMHGHKELAELIRNDPSFTDAFIKGSKEIDSQAFGTLPTKKGITEYVNELDAMAENHGKSYIALVNSYSDNPKQTLDALQKRDLSSIQTFFESYNRSKIAMDRGSNELNNTPPTEEINIARDGLSVMDHGLSITPGFSLNESFTLCARHPSDITPNPDIAQNDDVYDIKKVSGYNLALT